LLLFLVQVLFVELVLEFETADHLLAMTMMIKNEHGVAV
jgi:hypothetical protein